MSKPEEKKIYYVRESLVQSIIADAISWGFLIVVMTLNFVKWGGHWYVTTFLLIIWILFVMGKALGKTKQFYTRSELIDYLIKELEEEGENSK